MNEWDMQRGVFDKAGDFCGAGTMNGLPHEV